MNNQIIFSLQLDSGVDLSLNVHTDDQETIDKALNTIKTFTGHNEKPAPVHPLDAFFYSILK